MTAITHHGSFRDPSGFIFTTGGQLYRQVNTCYQPHYERLLSSGLYDALTAAGLLIPHTDAPLALAQTPDAIAVLQSERVPFISYPYEWCFSQLKDAALLTLRIQQMALQHGMSLKDATAYNVQFLHGAPVFIDTLSFECEREGEPWVAYRQFCQHFLAPLALMAHTDIGLGLLSRLYLDGVPLPVASRMLPRRTRWNLGLSMHLHMPAKFEQRHAGNTATVRRGGMTRQGLLGILAHLESTMRGLTWTPCGTEWAEYYTDTNYSERGFAHKRELVADYLAQLNPAMAWDLGANDGTFSRLAAARGIPTVAFDIDPAAVEKCYRTAREGKEIHLLPLVQDLTNPSPGIGWRGEERDSLQARGPVDVALALALIHHLAIGNNLPLPAIAAGLRELAQALIIEFVPKTDSQVQRLLVVRDDIFTDYTQDAFERAFTTCFDIRKQTPIADSQRTLYLLTAKV